MAIVKKRLSPEQSRAAALLAARQLLIEKGPQAVTLKAVADIIGRTHANVLHHFGSAAELQKSLAELIAGKVGASMADVVSRARQGQADPRQIVDLCFDAFQREGAGALVTWGILTGNRAAVTPIFEGIHDLVDKLAVGQDRRDVASNTLTVVYMALSDALIGPEMSTAVGLEDSVARDLALAALARSVSLANYVKPA